MSLNKFKGLPIQEYRIQFFYHNSKLDKSVIHHKVNSIGIYAACREYLKEVENDLSIRPGDMIVVYINGTPISGTSEGAARKGLFRIIFSKDQISRLDVVAEVLILKNKDVIFAEGYSTYV